MKYEPVKLAQNAREASVMINKLAIINAKSRSNLTSAVIESAKVVTSLKIAGYSMIDNAAIADNKQITLKRYGVVCKNIGDDVELFVTDKIKFNNNVEDISLILGDTIKTAPRHGLSVEQTNIVLMDSLAEFKRNKEKHHTSSSTYDDSANHQFKM